MKQSPNDHKKYRAITLANGLRVLLIHNDESEKSAAALAVNVGHFSDPKNRQGMAHFLEHMLFLGTEKYPDGSEYQKFISQYGGSNNAWTATEHTCFFFDIHASHFANALSRFSQFFIAPLLSEEFVNKERQNIDAEFKLKLKDDVRRLYDVHKETVNQDHPFAKFSVGNCETLADHCDSILREELQLFFNTYYRAQYMTLAIEGPHSLDELTELAQQYFSAIKSTHKPLPQLTVPLYLPEHQQNIIHVKPVRNDKQLIISFAMPCIDHFYQHKPESVLAYLLGHEGPGSILSLLKANQWAMGLTAGSGINGSNFKDFNISIPLTDAGEQHIDEIVNIIFGYIFLLKDKPLPEHYYQEKQSIAELSFHYHEKQRPLDSVSQLVLNMQHYPAKDYIFGDYMMSGMCQDTIDTLLSYLTPKNMRLIHISQLSEFNQVSTWYKVPYRVEKISDDKLFTWLNAQPNDALYLPPKNPYIVANPKVLASENIGNGEPLTPKCIESVDGLAVWFKQDTTFNVPKGYIYIGIDAPMVIESIENIAMAHLYADLYSDAIIEEHYDAELAGIHYHLYTHQGGMTLQLSGISQNQSHLLSKLLTTIKTYTFNQQRFELLKKQLLTHWNNADKSKSISQLFSKLSSAMQPKNPESDALALALTQVTYEKFHHFSQNLFDQIALNILIHGNWTKTQAADISEKVKSAFSSRYSNKYKVRTPVLDISAKNQLTFPIILPEHDHAAVLYYPQKEKDLVTTAKTIITSQLLSPLFFQEMRTEKQYGYLVGVGYVPINQYPGIAFYIQSPHTDSTSLTQAMDIFIQNSVSLLDEMTPEDWQHLQLGLAGQLQEKDASLRIKSQRFWGAISNEDITFSHKAQLIDALMSLTLDDIKYFIKHSLIPSVNPDRISLVSFSDATCYDKEHLSGTIIKNIDEIALSCPIKH
ncbi:insulinase family protein [Colwelliaceae bacterium 6471]